MTEFLIDGHLWLAGSVAGRGWSQPWRGPIDGINDTGTVVEPDGSERRIYWRPVAINLTEAEHGDRRDNPRYARLRAYGPRPAMPVFEAALRGGG